MSYTKTNKSREIKFRAWCKVGNLMLYDIQNATDEVRVDEIDSFFIFLDHPELYEVMQYTGLKDKNGKEIYNGDIVKYKRVVYGATMEIKKSSVCFWKGSFMIDEKLVFPTNEVIQSLIPFSERIFDIEIIGNIHENPALLEVNDEN